MNAWQFDGDFVWHPPPELVINSNLQRFIDRHQLGTYEELMRRSTTDIAWFWHAVLRELDIHFYKPCSQVVDLSRGKAWPRWCVGGQMNIVHNLLDKYADTPVDDRIAITAEIEEGSTFSLTYRELRTEVNRMAAALRTLGLGPGDAVGVFMPMVPETVVAMLAIIKIGGIFLPLSTGFDASAIAARMRDADAKAFFTASGAYRRGEFCDMKNVAHEAARQIPTLKYMIVLQKNPAEGEPATQPYTTRSWHALLGLVAAGGKGLTKPEPTERTSAEAPMMLLYLSDPTGKPKGAVHTHCGFPVKAAQDAWHGLDLHPDETVFWVTDMGRMTGAWLVFSTLLLGATMMLYDGAPDYPGPDRLWELCAAHGVTALGVSPALVSSLSRHGDKIVQRHDLSKLRKFASTGQPWNPDPWMWLFKNVGHEKLPIINYCAGAEISGGIVMGNVLTPMKPCAFSGPVPGMAADVFDEIGKPVRGKVGELVIHEPWIGMTRGFWNDRLRYIDTYWSRWPDTWLQGDRAAIDDDGLWYILGRAEEVPEAGRANSTEI